MKYQHESGVTVPLILFKCLFCFLRLVPHYSQLLYLSITLCSSRKNPYRPQGGSSENSRGRWVLKAKILEAKYEGKMEFPGELAGGLKQKPSVGGVWIFSGTAHFVVLMCI